MLQSEDRNLLPLLVMRESVGKIQKYVSGFDRAIDFFEHDDQSKFNASLLLLQNIGEQAGRLSDKLKNRYGSFPFTKIRGLRNRIAHDYTGIDYEMVFDIAKVEIATLMNLLISLISSEMAINNFDIAELQVASQSPFYKHIDFNRLFSKI